MQIHALEFYAGIGGLHLALKRNRKFSARVVRAFDWDQNAIKVYEANHGEIVTKIDISTLSASFLASFQANLWLLSPACQPYTVLNPNAKGSLDPRAKSFLHLMQNVLPELVARKEQPKHLLIENVGGFEASTTRQFILSQLHSLGYTTAEFLLTPLQFGIPNSRLRYYLLAKAAPFVFPTSIQSGITYRCIPPPSDSDSDSSSAWIDPRDSETANVNAMEISHYLDSEEQDDSATYAIPDRVLEKWGRLFDIVLPTAKRSCCFTRGYTQLVERAGSILQTNMDLDTSKTFDFFFAAQAAGDTEVKVNAVSILHPLQLRYFTPSELLRIFHFNPPSTYTNAPLRIDPLVLDSNPRVDDTHRKPNFEPFIWPPNSGISTKTKYRLIGNSVNVHVVTQLIDFLFHGDVCGSELELF
ncbi:S-adenosyl-L-methionine-dependent methyltransferase [Gymnopus androsaceus JB14]|uniref:tRNA (cytosine(38)-C(5))-methyltransferase n=1 Tax=Gymnopus androsaceus JB14 TaxID=1447944 RepID=A0A6A4I976_9AGAR|nr:S-adenosyl-L-methionine-dependent methyltransferase [Gymnopus androsaceus JB14]